MLKEFLMFLMDRNFNPFATCILNKQGHIINGNIPVALRFVTFFSHTSEPTSVLFPYKRASNYITDNQYFSGTRELTLKCKLKCYFKPMNNPLGVSPSKGKQGTTRGKEKIF